MPAWEYYQHADNLQHQRHAIFILVQSILFAGLVASEKPDPRLLWVIGWAGVITSLLWLWLAQMLALRMKVLTKELKKDKLYDNYLKAVPKWLPTGGLILNGGLPLLTGLTWIWILRW